LRRPVGRRPHRSELSGFSQQNYVDQCETALLMRRMWTIPVVAISGLVLLAVITASAITSARESLVPHRDTA
jgi:hypothetical protein